MFLIYGAYYQALSLHAEMLKERHMPTPKLQALIVALQVAESKAYNASDDEILAVLRPILIHPAYTEDALRHLLHFLCEIAPSGALVDRVLDAFIESRNSELKASIPRRRRTRSNYGEYELNETTVCALVNIHSRLGTYSSAEALLEDSDAADVFRVFLAHLPDNDDVASSSSGEKMPVYSGQKPPPPHMRAEEVLVQMAKSSVAPDLPLFNVLIAREVRLGQPEKAFAVFQALLAAGCVPDGFTFASLFSALKKLERARLARIEGRRRSARTRKVKDYDHAGHLEELWPLSDLDSSFSHGHRGTRLRALYHAMLYTHAKETTGRMAASSKVINPSTLAVALRAFLAARDYAGAYVVMRTFFACKLEVPARAWVAVFSELSRRLSWELPQLQRGFALGSGSTGRTSSTMWTDQFLGSAVRDWTGMQGNVLKCLIYAQMMHLGQIRSVRLHLEPEDIIPAYKAQSLPGVLASSRGTAPSWFEDETYAMHHPVSAYRREVQKRNVIPSLKMLLGYEPFPEATVRSWAHGPLERLLRRAMLATLDPASSGEVLFEINPAHQDMKTSADAQRVSNAIAHAKVEMIPDLGRGMGYMYRHRKIDWANKKLGKRFDLRHQLDDSKRVGVIRENA
jgi:pentatricopeptide repeat protein